MDEEDCDYVVWTIEHGSWCILDNGHENDFGSLNLIYVWKFVMIYDNGIE